MHKSTFVMHVETDQPLTDKRRTSIVDWLEEVGNEIADDLKHDGILDVHIRLGVEKRPN